MAMAKLISNKHQQVVEMWQAEVSLAWYGNQKGKAWSKHAALLNAGEPGDTGVPNLP